MDIASHGMCLARVGWISLRNPPYENLYSIRLQE